MVATPHCTTRSLSGFISWASFWWTTGRTAPLLTIKGKIGFFFSVFYDDSFFRVFLYALYFLCLYYLCLYCFTPLTAVGNVGFVGREWILIFKCERANWLRRAVIQEREKDAVGSSKAKRIQQSAGNWRVSGQHVRNRCWCEAEDWRRKILNISSIKISFLADAEVLCA